MTRTSTLLVSIITPTYNHENYVGECIESVLQQTYANWEQIVIDDGSSDNTRRIVASFKDPRIRYEHQANQGPFQLANTYNRALSFANGDLIAILEGDDFWPAQKLARLVPAFLNDDIVLAYGEAVDVDAKGQEQRTKSHTTRLRRGLSQSVLFNTPVGAATRYMLLAEGRSLVSPSSVLIRRTALEAIGGFQQVSGLPLTDYPTFIELSLLGKFHYSPYTAGYRRRHQNSITAFHGQTIHEMVSSFTLGFLNRHRSMIALSAPERKKLEQNWQKAEGKMHFTEGRSSLLRRNWAKARSHFRMTLKAKDPTVRLAGSAGLLLSWLHMDLEPLMKLGGRADLRVDDPAL